MVPPQGRSQVVNELNETHPRICKVESLARSYVWWPNMESTLQNKVRTCNHCQIHRKSPPEAPLHPWEWPSRPWERVHIDYAGPFLGTMFPIMVDASSKWLEIHPTRVTTSRATIEKLQATFATHGIPTTLVSDNGSNFCREAFEDFLTKNDIHHRKTAPYHPSSNGLAERAVQTIKDGMKKMSEEGSLETRVSRFLFKYRITPHSTTRVSPAEMLMGRKPRSRLDLLHPDIRSRVQNEQVKQKEIHDQHAVDRRLQPGDTVYAREFVKQHRWGPGVITVQTGPVSYTVQLDDQREVRGHQDQVIQRAPQVSRTEPRSTNVNVEAGTAPSGVTESTLESMEENRQADPNLSAHPAIDQQADPGEKLRRYPHRERRTPNFYY